jgi:ribosomal protein L37E
VIAEQNRTWRYRSITAWLVSTLCFMPAYGAFHLPTIFSERIARRRVADWFDWYYGIFGWETGLHARATLALVSSILTVPAFWFGLLSWLCLKRRSLSVRRPILWGAVATGLFLVFHTITYVVLEYYHFPLWNTIRGLFGTGAPSRAQWFAWWCLMSVWYLPSFWLAVVLGSRLCLREQCDDKERCRRCGYLLYGLPIPRCPECGTPFTRAMDVQPDSAPTVTSD